MKKLAGKVAIVTGASKGIGAAVAKALAAEGAAVAVIYSSGKEGAERLVSQITREGGKASAIQADVSKAADVKRMFEKTKEVFGSVNVLGTILATQEALRYFPSSGGSIINISSIASENPVPNSCLYSATKGAIDTITKALAKELGPRNIRVNTVAPGLVDTEGNRDSGFVGSAGGKRGRNGDSAGREIWQAGGNRASHCFSRLRGCGVADRRTNQRFRRPTLRLAK